MKFALSFCFIAALSSTPALARLRSSHGGMKNEATTSNRGRKVSEHPHHHKHHEPRTSHHETREEGTGRHGRPTSESHQEMMEPANKRGGERVGMQKIIWASKVIDQVSSDDTGDFDTKIVGGNSASVGEYPYYGKL
jgi:hypothetical protein